MRISSFLRRLTTVQYYCKTASVTVTDAILYVTVVDVARCIVVCIRDTPWIDSRSALTMLVLAG